MSEQGDVQTLGLGIVQGWFSDLDEALSRLVLSGLAHPDPELPVTLELLGERATELGLPTGEAHLLTLARLTGELRPGPPDLASRTALARSAWDELMAMLAWLGLLRSEIALREAGLRARGVEVELDGREDLPRFSGRVWIDGVTLVSERLVIIGHDADGAQLLIFDPLAEVRVEDPFGRTVISRLFQAQIHLADLTHQVIDFERHPVAQRGSVRMLQPAFRAVPVPQKWSGPAPPTDAVTAFEIHASVSDQEVRVRPPPQFRVQVGRTLKFNLLKLLAREARGGLRVSLTGLSRRDGMVVIASRDPDGLGFPAVDARTWRVHPELLAESLEGASVWLQAAVASFDGLTPPEQERVFAAVASSRSGDVQLQKLSWWAARLGVDLPSWQVCDPGPTPEQGFAGVWLRLWHGRGDLTTLLTERYTDFPDPALHDVCARALLMDAVSGDRDGAVAYLRAHLAHSVKRGRTEPVLPSSAALVAAADTLCWLTDAQRSGPVGDGLAAPPVPLRERVAWALYRWMVHRDEADLADDLALASVSRWGQTVIG